jgi:hypothetical protein
MEGSAALTKNVVIEQVVDLAVVASDATRDDQLLALDLLNLRIGVTATTQRLVDRQGNGRFTYLRLAVEADLPDNRCTRKCGAFVL